MRLIRLVRCQSGFLGIKQYPLGVKSSHWQGKKEGRLTPQKRTCAVQIEMSAMGQKRTLASKQSTLCAFEHKQHVLVASALLSKSDQRLIFGRVVPSVQRIHVRKFYHHDPLRLPVAAFWHFVASALC